MIFQTKPLPKSLPQTELKWNDKRPTFDFQKEKRRSRLKDVRKMSAIHDKWPPEITKFIFRGGTLSTDW